MAGCSISDLADAYGTPLYVFDESAVRQAARRTVRAFQGMDTRVSFAAKACATVAVLQIIRHEGVELDVVSAGEMEAARRAGFEPCSMHLHGNVKTDAELVEAVREGVRAIVLDSLAELERLRQICNELRANASVLLRLALPLQADTHPSLRTAATSKFGFDSAAEAQAIDMLRGCERVRLIGLHCHLGSQITDASLYRRSLESLASRVDRLRDAGFLLEELSIGGGWAVPYRPGDAELTPHAVAAAVIGVTTGLRLAIEPGRAIVARSALAVYRVATVKRVGSVRLVAVDGGMGDNPRPALYGAKYSVLPAAAPFRPSEGPVQVVGRYCESGDVLVHDSSLPEVMSGDLIVIPVAGAYQLSMAGSYNLVPPPAVTLVAAGAARLIVRRATTGDLLTREIPLPV